MKDNKEEVRSLIIEALTQFPRLKKPISGWTKLRLRGPELAQFCGRVEALSNRRYIVPPRCAAQTVDELADALVIYNKL